MREMVWKHAEKGGRFDSTRITSTKLERTRPVMAMAASNWTFSNLLVEVADRWPGCDCIFKLATHNHDVDLTTVRSMPSPGHAY